MDSANLSIFTYENECVLAPITSHIFYFHRSSVNFVCSGNPFLRLFAEKKITSLYFYFIWSSMNFVCNEKREIAPKKKTAIITTAASLYSFFFILFSN